MSDTPILPTADAVITPVLEKLYELRPNSFRHLNYRTGVYWHPVLGYRAQAAKMLARLAQLAAARRLTTAEKQELRDYVASEYDLVLDDTPTFAEGTATLGRGTSALPGGSIPKGTRLTRQQFTALGVTFQPAVYETLTDVSIVPNSSASVTVPVRAIIAGEAGNTPVLTANATYNVSIPNIVSNVSVTAFEAAGGSSGIDDSYIRLLATLNVAGQYGPTTAASKLGALQAPGVRHFLAYDVASLGAQKVLVADKSWGSSDRWAASAQQSMYDAELVGFGCRVIFDKVRNKVIQIAATVALRDANYLSDTTEIDIAIAGAARSYFDDRLDWNIWNADSLKAAITNAHAKIFNCSAVTVTDANDASVISEILSPDYTTEQFHYYVATNGVSVTYSGPG